MKNVELLKMLNDIDEKFLTEEYQPNLKKRYRISFKERMNEMRNVKLKYVLTPAIAFSIVLTGIVMINNYDNKTGLEIAKDNETIETPMNNESNEDNKFEDNQIQIAKEDNITFSNNNMRSSVAIKAKSVKINVISDFEFLENLSIPKEYELKEQLSLYKGENTNDTEYKKLWQYELHYLASNSNDSEIEKNINIVFTKEDYILACNTLKTENLPISTINGKDIYLFKSNNDLGKQAFFEYKGYKFFIESTKLTENEFVDLIKSIIQ